MERRTPRLPEGHELAHFAEIDSTNLEAVRRAEAGTTGPLWIWADGQRAGRGRLGRAWISAPGDLCATLLSPLAADERASDLSFVAALSVHDAADACLPREKRGELALKWPNDLLLGGKKCAGVLIERAGPRCVAIGCGVNLGDPPEGNLRRPATGLARHGAEVGPAEVLDALAGSLDRRLSLWRAEGFAAVRSAWLERAAGVGETIEANLDGRTLKGRFDGLDENGALLLKLADGGISRILAADVELAA